MYYRVGGYEGIIDTLKIISADGNSFKCKWFGGQNDGDSLIVEFTGDELRFITDGDTTIQLKSPLRKGESWETAEGEEVLEIEDVNATVSVPGGTFGECLKVIIQGTDSYYIYAPNVGRIRVSNRYSYDACELLDYTTM